MKKVGDRPFPLESSNFCLPNFFSEFKELHAEQTPLDESLDLSHLDLSKKRLGSGSFGYVLEGTCDGKPVAAKIFKEFGITADCKKEIENIRCEI